MKKTVIQPIGGFESSSNTHIQSPDSIGETFANTLCGYEYGKDVTLTVHNPKKSKGFNPNNCDKCERIFQELNN